VISYPLPAVAQPAPIVQPVAAQPAVQPAAPAQACSGTGQKGKAGKTRSRRSRSKVRSTEPGRGSIQRPVAEHEAALAEVHHQHPRPDCWRSPASRDRALEMAFRHPVRRFQAPVVVPERQQHGGRPVSPADARRPGWPASGTGRNSDPARRHRGAGFHESGFCRSVHLRCCGGR